MNIKKYSKLIEFAVYMVLAITNSICIYEGSPINTIAAALCFFSSGIIFGELLNKK